MIAKRDGAYVIEVNVEETPISPYIDITILGKTRVVLPRLVQLLRNLIDTQVDSGKGIVTSEKIFH